MSGGLLRPLQSVRGILPQIGSIELFILMNETIF
jgi:hypothetical protein